MKYYADLHIHSRFSRATSRDLTLPALALGAVRKGLAVIGTGDFTHPTWLSEIEQTLQEAEPGLYRLPGEESVRFILTAEISTIYKQADKVRKVHHLLLAPDIATVRTINKALASIGNIISDGRPILGISSRDLLEIVLSANTQACLIPAHIWTPWFSALGSKSGFDAIAECYLDLAPHIFAVETGLSSDPAMNYQVKSLDAYRLVSNSDAHSAEKLGREATVFTCALDYFAMRTALATGEGLAGTVEFFPEEGKYHLDGHRDCGVVLEPEETERLKGRCPVCGKPLTVGVLSRVHALADRSAGAPPTAKPFFSAIPLKEMLGEILQVGPAAGKVKLLYENLLRKLGPELPILLEADLDSIRTAGGETLALAVERMRTGKVHKQAGFDGQFGRIRVFRDSEIDLLFDAKPGRRTVKKKPATTPDEPPAETPPAGFNPAQQEAIAFDNGFLIVQAGPGTGKTRVLTERMRSLKHKGGRSILAITFTTKACEEIRSRLDDADLDVYTFHALAARILRDSGVPFAVVDEDILAGRAGGPIDDLLLKLSTLQPLDEQQSVLLRSLQSEDLYTFEGLIYQAMELLSEARTHAWDHVLVDEFQDINPLQYAFLKLLTPQAQSLMVIGDPHQAIYSFRGGSPRAFDDFVSDFPGARRIDFTESYRLNKVIAAASNALIAQDSVVSPRDGLPIRLIKTLHPPRFIAREIDGLLGGLSHTTAHKATHELPPSQIAVIVRTRSQAAPVMAALAEAGIPFDAFYARPLSATDGIHQRLALLEGDILPHIRGIGAKTLALMHAGGDPGETIASRIREAWAFLDALPASLHDRLRALEDSPLFALPPLDPDHRLYDYARTFGADTADFLTFCRLQHDAPAGEKVRVLTAHAAKGLEFGCVFITGQYPLPGTPPWEEQNLFYVAMTRAVDLLYICTDGLFAAQIPQELVRLQTEKSRFRTEQMMLFE